MAKNKKDSKSSLPTKGKHSNDANRSNTANKNGMRTASTVGKSCLCCWLLFARSPCCVLSCVGETLAQVRRLSMYNSKAKRNREGKIISQVGCTAAMYGNNRTWSHFFAHHVPHVLNQEFQSRELPNTRIQPDRRWFGNTRVIGQKQLETFREEMAAKLADPYAVVIKEKKLPLSLLKDPEGDHASRVAARQSLVATQPFADTFGKSQKRKRPKLMAESYEALLTRAGAVEETYVGFRIPSLRPHVT